MRSEQKERDALVYVKLRYAGYDRKRRVINYDAITGIVYRFVVSSRVKRPYYDPPGYIALFINVRQYEMVNVVRSITVVGCFLRLEFIQKLVVFCK